VLACMHCQWWAVSCVSVGYSRFLGTAVFGVVQRHGLACVFVRLIVHLLVRWLSCVFYVCICVCVCMCVQCKPLHILREPTSLASLYLRQPLYVSGPPRLPPTA
jgi:predicted membrane channel-forming protein YqfA (hemolysin III family)